jgi:hypothetical protein
LAPGDVEFCGNELKIWNVDPILRDLNILSGRTIGTIHIFRDWTDKHRKAFCASLERIGPNPIKRCIFLTLTKATPRHAITVTASQVIQAMNNFEIEQISDNRGENTRRLLLYLFRKLAVPSPLSIDEHGIARHSTDH